MISLFYPYENNTVSRQIKVLEKKLRKYDCWIADNFLAVKCHDHLHDRIALPRLWLRTPLSHNGWWSQRVTHCFRSVFFIYFLITFVELRISRWAQSASQFRADPLHSGRLRLWMNDCSFTQRVLNIHWSGYMVPRETAAISAQVLCTPCYHTCAHQFTVTDMFEATYARCMCV